MNLVSVVGIFSKYIGNRILRRKKNEVYYHLYCISNNFTW